MATITKEQCDTLKELVGNWNANNNRMNDELGAFDYPQDAMDVWHEDDNGSIYPETWEDTLYITAEISVWKYPQGNKGCEELQSILRVAGLDYKNADFVTGDGDGYNTYGYTFRKA